MKALNEFTSAQEILDANSLTKDLSLEGMVSLKQSFLQLEQGLDKVETDSEGKLIPGNELLAIIFQNGFPPSSMLRAMSNLDSISSFLSGNNFEAKGCDQFVSVLRVLSSQSFYKNPVNFSDAYRV